MSLFGSGNKSLSPEQALQEEMTKDSQLTRLLKMAGLQSTHRNLAMEDQLVADHLRKNEGIMSKGQPEDMEILATGDVQINQGKKGIPGWAAALIAAAAAGAGIAGASLLPGQEQPPSVEQPVDSPEYGLRLPD